MKKKRITTNDYLRANRKASRELEHEHKGVGFHSAHRIHKSAKQYVRKLKHKKKLTGEE